MSCCPLMPPGLELSALCPCEGQTTTGFFHMLPSAPSGQGMAEGYVMCSRGSGVLITGGCRNTGSIGTLAGL